MRNFSTLLNWGLRNYDTEPIIWDGDVNCKHEWDTFKRKGMSGGKDHKQDTNKGSWFDEKIQGFCKKCGAWSGSLGLEPTHTLFIKHLTDIFREVRRILKPHGTLWLNIGDSYVSAKSGSIKNYTGAKYGFGPNHKHTKESMRRPDKKVEGLKSKNLIGIPWRLAFSLQDDGWILRQDIIWQKINCMPESVKDRCTKSHEYVFLFTKNPKYYYDAESIKVPYAKKINRLGGTKLKAIEKGSDWDKNTGQPTMRDRDMRPDKKGKNRRSVWSIPTKGFKGAHFATFPTALIEPCVKAGASEKGVCSECGSPWKRITLGWEPTCDCNKDILPAIVFDPFMGSGTTAVVAKQNGRDYLGCELSAEYIKLAEKRINDE